MGPELGPAGKELPVQEFVPELVKGALQVAVLPGGAGLDEGHLDALVKRQCAELGAIVRIKALGPSMNQKHPLQLPLHRRAGKMGRTFEKQAPLVK
jgi:hypothetical protein